MSVKLPSALLRMQERLAQQEEAPLFTAPEAVEQEEEAPAPTPPQPVASPEKTVEYWEHRFKTLQGMEAAEKKRLKDLLSSQEAALKDLAAQLDSVKKSVPREFDLRQYLSEEELATLDKEQLTATLKVATQASSVEMQEEIKRHINPLKEELEKVNKTTQEAKVAAFLDVIEIGVPDFREINNDPRFHDWLAVEDALTGNTRQAALEAAEKSLNAKRVVTIFKAFLETLKKPEKDLSRQVQPNGSHVTPNTNVSGVPSFTRAEVAKFYSDVRRGVYRGRTKEMEEMERKIERANDMGKIT